jgi:transcriptional regulator with GAF, ATPase, and Fis domain
MVARLSGSSESSVSTSLEDRIALLSELGVAFAAQLDLDELLSQVVTRCREVLRAEGVSVLLFDEESNELYFPYVADADAEVAERLAALRFPADRGIAGAVLASGEVRHVADVSADPDAYRGIDEATGMTTREVLAAPLAARDGRIGVLQIINPLGGRSFDDGEVELVRALSGHIGVAIENARLYGELVRREANLRDEVGTLRRDIAVRDRFSEIVGSSPAMQPVFDLMESAAASPISVLVEGATGVGKELVARGIHRASPRADRPFVAVNCGALPKDLVESQLFGHAKGSFTGANAEHRGLFEAADQGTVFLDEVGELTPDVQVKLLRVLQEGEVLRVGATTPRKIDVRVIAATNRDLRADVESGKFREDLFYRIAPFPIPVPPLKERAEDIPAIAENLLDTAAERHGKKVAGFDPAAVAVLANYDWPGNVRQLSGEIERAVALTPAGGVIEASAFSQQISGAPSSGAAVLTAVSTLPAGASKPLREARETFEIAYIRDCLARHDGNVSHTAEALGISRVMLQKKMKAFGLR